MNIMRFTLVLLVWATSSFAGLQPLYKTFKIVPISPDIYAKWSFITDKFTTAGKVNAVGKVCRLADAPEGLDPIEVDLVLSSPFADGLRDNEFDYVFGNEDLCRHIQITDSQLDILSNSFYELYGGDPDGTYAWSENNSEMEGDILVFSSSEEAPHCKVNVLRTVRLDDTGNASATLSWNMVNPLPHANTSTKSGLVGDLRNGSSGSVPLHFTAADIGTNNYYIGMEQKIFADDTKLVQIGDWNGDCEASIEVKAAANSLADIMLLVPALAMLCVRRKKRS